MSTHNKRKRTEQCIGRGTAQGYPSRADHAPRPCTAMTGRVWRSRNEKRSKETKLRIPEIKRSSEPITVRPRTLNNLNATQESCTIAANLTRIFCTMQVRVLKQCRKGCCWLQSSHDHKTWRAVLACTRPHHDRNDTHDDGCHIWNITVSAGLAPSLRLGCGRQRNSGHRSVR